MIRIERVNEEVTVIGAVLFVELLDKDGTRTCWRLDRTTGKPLQARDGKHLGTLFCKGENPNAIHWINLDREPSHHEFFVLRMAFNGYRRDVTAQQRL